MGRSFNIFVFFRILIGLFFLIVSGDKLIGHFQNFLYVVQSYQLFPEPLDSVAALIVPWWEFLCSVLLILGLWLRRILQALLVLISGFIIVVLQAIVRGLPLEECGCFGDLISLPLHGIIILDTAMGVLILIMLLRLPQTSALSLDNYFLKNQQDS